MKHPGAGRVVLVAGVVAALHIGKVPPALPLLRESLGISLLQAGFLLSLVQLAGMLLGLTAGLVADGIGLKRSMIIGLLILFVAGALGGWAQDVPALLALRALEGLGLLLACMPAPGLIRRLIGPGRTGPMLGLWGACMPFGTALALLAGPMVIMAAGWQGWWWLLAAFSLVMAAWLWQAVPADATPSRIANVGIGQTWPQRLRTTLSSVGPWLVAATFAMYSCQWLAVIGFLPSIYAQTGLSAGMAGVLTALAAAANMVGNIASGRLVQRGVRPRTLLYIGFAVMGLGAALAFSPSPGFMQAAPVSTTLRYVAVVLFSMVGGLIPGTLFILAVQVAPGESAVSTTVGWVQQWSAMGQLAGAPLVAFVATAVGGWHWTWAVTGTCSLAGWVLATAIGRLPSGPADHKASTEAPDLRVEASHVGTSK
jgi:MFS family permease